MNKQAMVMLAAGVVAEPLVRELARLELPVAVGPVLAGLCLPVRGRVLEPELAERQAQGRAVSPLVASSNKASSNSNRRRGVTLGTSGFTMLPARSTRPSSTRFPSI